jgi:hypothetical protein
MSEWNHEWKETNAHVHFENVALFLLELFDVRLGLFDGLAGAGECLDERLVDIRNGPSCKEGKVSESGGTRNGRL